MKPKKEQTDNVKLFESLFARNRMILMELQNLILSVTSTRVSIVNPTIFDQDDLNILISDDKYANTTISVLMNVSSIKVILGEEFLYLVIRYPKLEALCKKLVYFQSPISDG